MSDRHHIALLPGLDGTGELFSPIIPQLEQHFEVSVIKYSDQTTLDEFVSCAQQQLPDCDNLSLVAESFSGPIAIALLADDKRKFCASVLSATFCKTPLPYLTPWLKHLPKSLFGDNAVNRLLLDFLVTDKETDSEIKALSTRLLKTVKPEFYKNRIRLIDKLELTQQLKSIKTPMLYIRASKDLLIHKGSAEYFHKNSAYIELAEVEGPHMILQTRPQVCAELIRQHILAHQHTS